MTQEKKMKLFDEFRQEFTCIADDTQLKEWGNSREEIKRIKIKGADCILKLSERGIRVGEFIKNENI